jgi:hypothetical protein
LSGKAFIQRMSPVILPLLPYLESGSQEAYEHHDQKRRGHSINNHLFCGIVRDHVCRRVDELLLAGQLPIRREIVANSGIRLYYDRIGLKVLRPGIDEDGDAVLPPAKSDQQALFYGGNYYQGDDGEIVIQNLVMLWQSNHVTRSVSAWLACPIEGGEQLFCEPIPHPATAMRPEPPRRTTPEDDSDLYQREDTEEPLTESGGEEEGDE